MVANRQALLNVGTGYSLFSEESANASILEQGICIAAAIITLPMTGDIDPGLLSIELIGGVIFIHLH